MVVSIVSISTLNALKGVARVAVVAPRLMTHNALDQEATSAKRSSTATEQMSLKRKKCKERYMIVAVCPRAVNSLSCIWEMYQTAGICIVQDTVGVLFLGVDPKSLGFWLVSGRGQRHRCHGYLLGFGWSGDG